MATRWTKDTVADTVVAATAAVHTRKQQSFYDDSI